MKIKTILTTLICSFSMTGCAGIYSGEQMQAHRQAAQMHEQAAQQAMQDHQQATQLHQQIHDQAVQQHTMHNW